MFAFEELKEKFLNIPEDIQEAISSNKVNEKLLALADKYKLQFDEAEELTKEIGYLMLGLKPKKDFVTNIQKVSELDSKKSKELAEEINNTIFADIRESLRKIHSSEEEFEDENLDEKAIREELLNEISNPTEKTTDLIKLPEESLKQMSNKTIKQEEQNSQSPISKEQNKPKDYTIDPYREPLD